eukprot:scaffold98014_cov46-Phaeocystis_antarctica.AAC.2
MLEEQLTGAEALEVSESHDCSTYLLTYLLNRGGGRQRGGPARPSAAVAGRGEALREELLEARARGDLDEGCGLLQGAAAGACEQSRLLRRSQCQTPGGASAALADGKGGGAERIGRLALCPFKAVLKHAPCRCSVLHSLLHSGTRTKDNRCNRCNRLFCAGTGSNRIFATDFLRLAQTRSTHDTANTAPQQPCTHAPLPGHTLLCDGRPDHHEVRSSPATLWPRGRPEEGEQHRQPEQPQWRLGQHQCAVADARRLASRP